MAASSSMGKGKKTHAPHVKAAASEYESFTSAITSYAAIGSSSKLVDNEDGSELTSELSDLSDLASRRRKHTSRAREGEKSTGERASFHRRKKTGT